MGVTPCCFFGYIRPLSNKEPNLIFHSRNDEELWKFKIFSRFRFRVSVRGSSDTGRPTIRTKHAPKGILDQDLLYKTFSAPTVSMLSNFPVQPSLLRGSIIIEAGSIAFYPLLNIQDSHRQRVRKNLNGIPLTQIQTKSDGSPSKFQRNQQILCRVCTLCVALETLKWGLVSVAMFLCAISLWKTQLCSHLTVKC